MSLSKQPTRVGGWGRVCGEDGASAVETGSSTTIMIGQSGAGTRVDSIHTEPENLEEAKKAVNNR